MSLAYKVEIAPHPPLRAFTWTAESETVQTIELDLHKDHKAISTLNVRLYDPKVGSRWWPLFNTIADPTFSDVPVKLSLADPNLGPSSMRLVFDGKLASLQPGYPGPSHTTFVAHDHSLTARMQARYSTYKGLRSVDVARLVAKNYGYDTDFTQLVDIVTTLTTKSIDVGMSTMGDGAFSDWKHLARALASDGLELYFVGKKLVVRQIAKTVYPIAFSPDDGNVITLEVTINHVGGPGGGGQSKAPLPGGSKGSAASATGAVATEAVKEGSVAVTHRTPPSGPAASHTGAHTESLSSRTGVDAQHRLRKDEATLVIRLSPDIGLHNVIPLKGWGKKIDGNWFIKSINHSVAGGAGTTTLHLTNRPSDGAKKAAGIALPGGTSAK